MIRCRPVYTPVSVTTKKVVGVAGELIMRDYFERAVARWALLFTVVWALCFYVLP